MRAQDSKGAQRRQDLDLISVRRNPYLVDFEEQRRLRRAVNESPRRSLEVMDTGNRRPAGTANRRNRRPVEVVDTGNRRRSREAGKGSNKSLNLIDTGSRRRSREGGERRHESLDLIDIGGRRMPAGRSVQKSVRQPSGSVRTGGKRNAAAARKAAERRRRKRMIRRKIMAAAWLLCIFMIGWLFLLKRGNASELEQKDSGFGIRNTQAEEQGASSTIIQGISSEQFAKHPTWEEDFLPINEYSRPGETLPQVKDIFVHYTANPGTSAAQNHSYFEQQKDMHEASVSAHFIIGYEGEIIQCVPLDEIAYAVQTRNYDSISIECCYKARDGSFTQETYDSLISLLAWLTDTYGLSTDHILRHYDCGGKKCPLYYTEHEDAWVRLKGDVAARQEK